jgi:hypothetical protein
VPEYTVRS